MEKCRIVVNKKLQGRVQFPIGGILREPAMAGTGAIPVATVKVWMEEDFLKSFFIIYPERFL